MNYEELCRLKERDIKATWWKVHGQKQSSRFLKTFAGAVLMSEGDDFFMIRPAALFLIDKYQIPVVTEKERHEPSTDPRPKP